VHRLKEKREPKKIDPHYIAVLLLASWLVKSRFGFSVRKREVRKRRTFHNRIAYTHHYSTMQAQPKDEIHIRISHGHEKPFRSSEVQGISKAASSRMQMVKIEACKVDRKADEKRI
jgi:hypothetical protein